MQRVNKEFKVRLYLVSNLLMFSLNLYSQAYTLKIQTIPEYSHVLSKSKAETYPDSISVIKKLNEVLSDIREDGYLLAEIKQVTWDHNNATARIHINSRFRGIDLQKGNVPEWILNKAGYNELSNSLSFNNSKLNELFKNILKVYEDSGFPFASVELDSVNISNNTIKAVLKASKGEMFVYDSLKLAGNVRISPKFLESYLDLKSGFVYQESSVRNIEERLAELPFFKSVKSPQIKFSANKATITLFLEKQNSNTFDGILGFLPNDETGKLQVIGDLKLNLNNPFKRAENIDFNYKGLPQKSKELNMGLTMRELFSTPVGLDFRFNIFKRDTNYQNINTKISLHYRIPKGRLSFFMHNRSGLPANSDTLSNDIPVFANTKSLSYGIGFLYRTLNSTFQPRRGLTIEVSSEAGKRKVSGLKSLNNSRISQYRVNGDFDFYLPFSSRGILRINNQTAVLIGKKLFENELYRIGGFSSLRGFDEQSILASSYSLINTEYRLLIENSSYLFAFFNQAFTHVNSINLKRSDWPLGFGAGINLQVKTGMFSLSYALGKQRDNPLNLQSGKIHFGLITLF